MNGEHPLSLEGKFAYLHPLSLPVYKLIKEKLSNCLAKGIGSDKMKAEDSREVAAL